MRARSPPLLADKRYSVPSYFTPQNLLREARRQLGKKPGRVPTVCVLDPDGEATRSLIEDGSVRASETWACHHTRLYELRLGRRMIGVVPFAVGASFAVLVAEELFASGCRLLISITSAGLVDPRIGPPVLLLIEKALRDEGTSYHYLPPSDFSLLEGTLRRKLERLLDSREPRIIAGTTWTTDAPFRETPHAIARARRRGVQAVETEAAALYAFAAARKKPVVCFALITNRMGSVRGDFEKGQEGGTKAFLTLVGAVARTLD